jgi:hypothetical protein
MVLRKVKSHHYTHRTASVDPTVSEMKANLLNNTSKVTVKLTSHSFTHSPTPWSKVYLEKLTGFSPSQEITRVLCNPKDNYRIELVAIICPFLEPDQSTPCSPFKLPEDPSSN